MQYFVQTNNTKTNWTYLSFCKCRPRCTYNYVFSICHITKYFTGQNPLCAKKSFCFTDFGVRLFILQLSLRLRSGILHVYLFLFVYRSFFAFTNVYVSLLSHFSVFLPFRLWQIINWQACETYIFVAFCLREKLWYFGRKLYFLKNIFSVMYVKNIFSVMCEKLETKKQTDI